MPVDTGRLRNSVTHLLKGYDCFIGTNVEYAPYVEEGTSRMKGKHFLAQGGDGPRGHIPGDSREALDGAGA